MLEETAGIADEYTVIPRPADGKWRTCGCIMGDGWSIAWRVLDAQFWGVPQRRRRIALVADFGGQSAPEILFVRKSLSGNPETCGTQRKGTAGNAKNGADTAIADGAYCIQGNCVDRADTAGCNGRGWTEGVSYTLNTVDRPAVFAIGDGQANQTGLTVTCGALNCMHDQQAIFDARGNGSGKIS